MAKLRLKNPVRIKETIGASAPESSSEIQVTREHVLARLDNWMRRLNQLYDRVDRWRKEALPATKSIREETFQAEEELMRHFAIKAGKVPTYSIINGEKRLDFIPSALWIIGANGRVNILGKKMHFILVDMSEPDDKQPKWMVVSPDSRIVLEDLDKEKLADLFARAA